MKKTVMAVALAVGMMLGGGSVAYAVPGKVPVKSRVSFSAQTKAKLATVKEVKLVSARAKKHRSPRAFEWDIRGCELQFKFRSKAQSDCLNRSIRVHKQFI